MSRLFQNNQTVGDYRIDGFLGAGGMGEVYRGVHLQLSRIAAIKVLRNINADSSLTQRFHNEARLQSNLHHPNIATLYDFKDIDGNLCIFMEYIDGESLEDLIKRRFFAVEDALLAFQKICEAIAFIHQNGVLHRDIKSQNIKLNSAGTIKLLDFGIAKDAESQKLTKTGGVIGTPSYIAPEQLDGKAADVQTDIWALGVLLYEMLTGDQPFKADTMGGLCLRIQCAEFDPPEAANPAVPRETSQIVRRCLEKDRTRRYQSVEEITRDTARVLNDKYQTSVLPFGNFSRTFESSPSETRLADNYDDDFEDRSYSPESKPRKNLFAAVAVGSVFAVLFVFGLIGIALWAMSGSDDGEMGNLVKEGNSPVLISTDKQTPDKGISTATSSENGGTQEVKIDVVEGTAKVLRDGAVIGETPFTLNGKKGETVKLTLRREGYQDREAVFQISSGKKTYTFTLIRKEEK